jgi:hypothetical protein
MELLSRIVAWLSDHEAAISAVAAIIVIGGVVFAGFRWLVSRRSQPTSELTDKTPSEEDPLLALPTGPVVAVLPFENLSRDPDQEYFSDGLTDDIITALSRFKDSLGKRKVFSCPERGLYHRQRLIVLFHPRVSEQRLRCGLVGLATP